MLPVVAAGPPVDEDHTGWGLPHAAVCMNDLRQARLPVSAAWMVLESACHWMLIALAPDWDETTGLASAAHRLGDLFHQSWSEFPMVEDDFDFTDVGQVVWAFASRAHPHHGEIYFEARAQNNLPVSG